MQMETSVFLFGSSPIESLALVAVVWAPVAGFISILNSDPLYWFMATLLVGFAFHMIYYQLIIIRYRNPIAEGEILDVLARARSDVGKGEDVQLWLRESDRHIFLSRATLRYKTILVSPSAVADILARPEKGKVVLAQRILMIEKARPLSRLVAGLLMFVAITGVSESFLFDFVLFMSATPLSWPIVGTLALALVVLVLVPLVQSARAEDVNEALLRIYGTSSQAAAVEVFQGIDIPEDVIQKAVEESEEEKPLIAARARKNGLISAIITFSIAFVVMTWIIGLDRFLGLLPFIVVFSAAFAGLLFWGAYAMTKMRARFSNIRRKRDSSSDYQDEYTESVKALLNREPGYEHLMVRGVRLSGPETEGLVGIDETTELDETTLVGILPDMLSLLRDPDLVVPYIIAEIERYLIEKKERRYSWIILGIAFCILIPGAIWGFVTQGFLGGMFTMLQILAVYILFCLVGFGVSYYWKKEKTIQADVAVATKYPRFREALQTLVEHHYTQPLGITSYKTRLDRINGKLGTPRFMPSGEAGIDLQ